MKRTILTLGLVAASLGLAGCENGRYYGRGSLSWSDYGYGNNGSYWYDPYWYDGYYGRIHGGYWGRDGHFYYRRHRDDRRHYRGSHDHFRRNESASSRNFRRYDNDRRWENSRWRNSRRERDRD